MNHRIPHSLCNEHVLDTMYYFSLFLSCLKCPLLSLQFFLGIFRLGMYSNVEAVPVANYLPGLYLKKREFICLIIALPNWRKQEVGGGFLEEPPTFSIVQF